jgi:sulfatase modifying factor 1
VVCPTIGSLSVPFRPFHQEAASGVSTRAGATTRYPWGDDPAGACKFANLQDRAGARRFREFNVPVPCDDGFALVAPVASLQPNALGFFDLVGNLEEWCRTAPDSSADHELTGGSWVADADGAARTHRASLDRHARRDFLGFRPALSVGTAP